MHCWRLNNGAKWKYSVGAFSNSAVGKCSVGAFSTSAEEKYRKYSDGAFSNSAEEKCSVGAFSKSAEVQKGNEVLELFLPVQKRNTGNTVFEPFLTV